MDGRTTEYYTGAGWGGDGRTETRTRRHTKAKKVSKVLLFTVLSVTL